MRSGSSSTGPPLRAGRRRRGFAEADVVVEAEYRTQTVLHNSMETHQSVCHWEGDTLVVYISTQFIWGVRDEIARKLGLPADRVRVICEYMGGGFGSKNGAGDYTFIAAELARRTGRPVRCALTRREEQARHRQPQRDDPARARGGARRRHARRARGRVRQHGRLGRLALPDRGADADALRLRERADGRARREDEHRADGRLPRARVHRGHVRAREPAGRARRASSSSTRSSCGGATTRTPISSAACPSPRSGCASATSCAERHWARRDEVRARSEGPWRRGVGLASQIWYGGGGPPSYAWLRLGSDGARGRRHGDAGHRHRLAHGDGADRRRGARAAARARSGRARRLGEGAVRLDLGRLLDPALDGPGGARGGGRRRAASSARSRRSASASRRTPSRSRAARSSMPTAAPGRSRS